MRIFAILVAFVASSALVNAQGNSKDISMFPKAKEGYKQHIIYLPEKKNESDLRVEITVGKEMEVDKCNQHFILGLFEEKNLDGWGYNYYFFDSKGNAGSTLMACPDDKKITKFVTGQGEIIRYNSKLPLVIYLPEGMTVKYRIWQPKKGWI